MRLANYAGRATLVIDGRAVDVHTASGGRFGSDPQSLFAHWAEFRAWAAGADAAGATAPAGAAGPPVPHPTQVFGIGLNYRDHAAETGRPLPTMPATFTKFPTCLTGDDAEVALPSAHCDWEVELVVVIGREARNVTGDAWEYVAGLTIGQDISERDVQYAAGNQFCLGKSYPGFGPTGPVLVTPDEVPDRDDLALTCHVNGEQRQAGRTSDMVFPVAELIERLSAIVTLLPGDIIFTGTPAGVGVARDPQLWLAPGDVITSTIEGIGTLRTRCR